jgi:predicted methyltransferase
LFSIAAVALALALGLQTAACSAPQKPDALTDSSMKGTEVIAFIGLKPGDRIADIVSGSFVRAFSRTVGQGGKVYAFEPSEVVKDSPEAVTRIQALASDPAYANVVLATAPIDRPALPSGLDAVFIRWNYHDLYTRYIGPADVGQFNRNVFAALKPGGVYVVLDHAAAAGSGLRDTNTIHRIDKEAVKKEILAAGFVLDGESQILANPADDHSKIVTNPAIRGKTDQFLLRFRKPG